jgi:hypothetical protein
MLRLVAEKGGSGTEAQRMEERESGGRMSREEREEVSRCLATACRGQCSNMCSMVSRGVAEEESGGAMHRGWVQCGLGCDSAALAKRALTCPVQERPNNRRARRVQ